MSKPNPTTSRPYKKQVIAEVPDRPELAAFLTPSRNVSSSSRSLSSMSPITPQPGMGSGSFSHQQPRLRAAKRAVDLHQSMENILQLISADFGSLGRFLAQLFINIGQHDPDPRPPVQRDMVSRFLQGNSPERPIHIIDSMFNNRYSNPSYLSKLYGVEHLFTSDDPFSFYYARPAISAWAVGKVGKEARHQIGALTTSKPDSQPRARIALSANTRQATVPVINVQEIFALRISELSKYFKKKAGLPWHLLETMTAPYKDGLPMVRKRRPHTQIITTAISSFIISRNRYANGYLAVAFGIWLFSCHSHVDTKRIMCRIGLSISDSSVRDALASLACSGQKTMRKHLRDAALKGEAAYCLILDNVQQYCRVHEAGLMKRSEMKVGCGATAAVLYNCPPGAFKREPYITKLEEMGRKAMTTESLWKSIDWEYHREAMALHFVRVLCEFVPSLQESLSKLVSERFRASPIAKHRMPELRKTEVQPLGTNSEKEIETKGMHRCIMDFSNQMGITEEIADDLLFWVRGDGASFAAIHRVKKFLTGVEVTPLESCENVITLPETWHVRSTCLSTISSNHFGEATSSDPSSISFAANLVDMKRPPDLKSCDFYSTSRTLNLCWNTQVLSAWMVYLETTDLVKYFNDLRDLKQLPQIDKLLGDARILRQRYASIDAYERALSLEDFNNSVPVSRPPIGTPWTKLTDSTSKEPRPQAHTEVENWDGDRCLANSALFLFEYGTWVDAAYSVPEGDSGRVWENIKIWLFMFAGTKNYNYTKYLLEAVCFFIYDAPPDLRTAVLNNWFMNLRGLMGAYVEGDLNQEHFNLLLEEMVMRYAGEWDDFFYRNIISPNIHNMLLLRGEFENAFELRHRSKTHTSPSQRNEYINLIQMYQREEIHKFRAGRTMGHAAKNMADDGYKSLDGGRMKDFVDTTTATINIQKEKRAARARQAAANIPIPPTSTPASSVFVDAMQVDVPESEIVQDPYDSDSDVSMVSISNALINAKLGEEDPDESSDPDDSSNLRRFTGSSRGVILDSDGQMIDEWDEADDFEKVFNDDEEVEQDTEEPPPTEEIASHYNDYVWN